MGRGSRTGLCSRGCAGWQDFGVERLAKLVRGEDVHAAVTDVRRRVDPVEKPLHAGPECLRCGAAAARSRNALLCTREVEQVSALGVVELQRS